jgi:hypothetical protein
MARQRGLFPFTGTMGGYTGWRNKNGDYFVKQKSKLDKKKIDKNPNMAPQKNMRKYFTLASKLSTEIRTSLQPFINQLHESDLHHKLTELCMEALYARHPKKCPAQYDLTALPEHIAGYRLSSQRNLFTHAPGLILKQAEGEDGWMDLHIGGWILPDKQINESGATHLRWQVVITAITGKEHIPQRNKIIRSEWMDIHKPQPWDCGIEYGPFLLPDGGVIIALVLDTAQFTCGEYYTMESIKAMNILTLITP